MHDTAMAAGAAFFSAYFEGAAACVLDVGALDVNGSLRSVAPVGSDYVGIDLEAGPGVDHVVIPGQALPFPAGNFDACLSVSCFEHDPVFWETFLHMAEVVKKGGYVFLNVPSNGPFHRYPADNWRFYPDAGVALADWARRRGQPIQVIESAILRRKNDVWNDFVAVFEKADAPSPRSRFLVDAFPDAMNVYRFDTPLMQNVEPITEDARLLQEAQARMEQQAREAQARAEAQTQEAEKLRAALKEQQESVRKLLIKIAELDTVLQTQRRHAVEQGEIVGNLQRALDRRQGDIDAILASKSWRMTAPLRAARRIMGS